MKNDIWTANEIPDQRGRVAVITGANTGLGLETAKALAARGATVVLAVRNLDKGKDAAASINADSPEADITIQQLDLSSLNSVRKADELRARHDRIDLLINNAGVMYTPKGTTADGFELQFGTNHLGHFALTGLLLDAVQRSESGRIVTLSSNEHKGGKIDFDDLQKENSYSPRGAYQGSKLANAVFAVELDRRLRASGSSAISVFAHPGYSATNLQSTGPTGVAKAAMAITNRVLAQSAERGALPTLYAATAPGVEGGDYYGPDGPGEFRGLPKKVEAIPAAYDPEDGRLLWEASEKLTGVSYL